VNPWYIELTPSTSRIASKRYSKLLYSY
jgi:hypothetical protein